jgi:uncharacterized protein (DUF2384 family)
LAFGQIGWRSWSENAIIDILFRADRVTDLVANSDDRRILDSAVVRMFDLWNLSPEERRTLEAIEDFDGADNNGRKLLLLRIWQSLDALTSGDDGKAAQWLRSNNLDMGKPPIDAMGTLGGLEIVADYLDGHRNYGGFG